MRNETGLLELGVFGLGLLEDGNVGVGVLPEGEEVLIGFAGVGAGGFGVRALRGLGLEHVRPSEAEMSESADGLKRDEAAVIEDFLKFGRGGVSLFGHQVCLPSDVWQSDTHGTPGQVIRKRCLEYLGGFRRIAAQQRQLRADRWNLDGLRDSILREAFCQVVRENLSE